MHQFVGFVFLFTYRLPLILAPVQRLAFRFLGSVRTPAQFPIQNRAKFDSSYSDLFIRIKKTPVTQ